MTAAHEPPPMSTLRATFEIAWKEVRASFRDRQTTLYTVVLPIVLYPLLFWALIQCSLFVQGRREHTEVRVAIGAPAGARLQPGLVDALRTPPPDQRRGSVLDAERVNVVEVGPFRQPLDEAGARELVLQRTAGELTGEHPDAVLLVPPQPESDADTLPDPRAEADAATIVFDSTVSASKLARQRVAERLPPYVKKKRLENLPPELGAAALAPFELGPPHDIAPEENRGAHALAVVLPMLLVVMTVMGAFFPAVDLTAGERERSTQETTLLLPVPRLAVHQGKILAVCTCAIVATALNLFALALTAGHLLHLWSQDTEIVITVPLFAFAAIAPLALLFAFFVSAALTGIASFARTFKEGQALLGPVQLVFIVPAMAGVIPGLAITPALAFAPVLNVVLVFRALLDGEAKPLEYTLTALALLAYTLIATQVAVRLLAREPSSGERRRAWFGFARGGAA